MRKVLCDSIHAGNNIDDCRKLAFDGYKTFYSESRMTEIPYQIREGFSKNADYETARKASIDAGLEVPPYDEYTSDNLSDDEAKGYIERLRKGTSDPETFIPVMVGIVCPAEILANQNQQRVNVFRYNKPAGQLELIKSLGAVDGDVVNILHNGLHFVRLYNPAEGGPLYKQQAEQIIKNS